MKASSTQQKTNVVQFPVEKLVAPSIFRVDIEIGTKVWFVHPKGVWVEGRLVSYFAHITPNEMLTQFGGVEGAKPADISNVGYAVEYFVPNPQHRVDPSEPLYIKQVQLLDASECFSSLEDLIENLKQRNVLKFPEDV